MVNQQRHRVVHRHQYLPYPLLGNALAQVRDSDAWWGAKSCIAFLAFTCVRSEEARMATWDEIDLDAATWSIPAARMKNRVAHRVPLSTQAQELLHHARAQTDPGEKRIFPPMRGAEYIARDKLSLLLKKLEIPTTTHGMRSSFRNWVDERTTVGRPIADIAMSHYPMHDLLRRDFFQVRQVLMQDWADYLSQTMGPVIQADQKSKEKA